MSLCHMNNTCDIHEIHSGQNVIAFSMLNLVTHLYSRLGAVLDRDEETISISISVQQPDKQK